MKFLNSSQSGLHETLAEKKILKPTNKKRFEIYVVCPLNWVLYSLAMKHIIPPTKIFLIPSKHIPDPHLWVIPAQTGFCHRQSGLISQAKV